MHRALPVLLVALAACRDPNARRVGEPPPAPPECGDGIVQEGEDCDASELGTATCQSLGFDTGRLVCAACRYDTTLCVKRCGNGVLDLGEACDGALGLAACSTWGFNACTDACTVDTRHCVTGEFDAAPELDLSKGGPAVLGDLAPRGPGDLVLAVPAFARVEIVPWNMTQGFEAVASRKLSFLRSPVAAELIDANADGTVDVATINADGSFDLLVNQGGTYALQTLDAGCAGGRFLPSHGAAAASAIVVGCGGFATVGQSGAPRTDTPSATAFTRTAAGVVWADATPELHFADGGVFTLPSAVSAVGLADLDADGDEDLAAISSAGVEVLENTGTGFAPRAAFTTTAPTGLAVIDLDGDDRSDLFWSSGDELVIRRNRGAFVFSEVRVAGGSGPRLSIALGDADGDQDLDVAVTVSTGADSTKTRTFRNRVR